MTPNAGENKEEHEFSFIAGGNVNGIATVENNLVWKTKHILTIQPSSCTLRYLLKRDENVCPYEHLHVGVCSSLIHNCQNLEATKMAFSKWEDKETPIHSDNEIFFGTKKKWAVKPRKDIEETYSWSLSNRGQSEEATYYMFPAIWHSRKRRKRRQWKARWLPGTRWFD